MGKCWIFSEPHTWRIWRPESKERCHILRHPESLSPSDQAAEEAARLGADNPGEKGGRFAILFVFNQSKRFPGRSLTKFPQDAGCGNPSDLSGALHDPHEVHPILNRTSLFYVMVFNKCVCAWIPRRSRKFHEKLFTRII